MRSLKNHFSVILSLFVLLFSLQFIIMTKAIIDNQNSKITKKYSLMVVSKRKLKIELLKNSIKEIDNISTISADHILGRLKKNMSTKNLALLKVSLPYFYSVKLRNMPDKKELEKIKKTLLKIKGITKVETFLQTYSRVFQMFQIFQIMTYIFSGIIIIISTLLLFKQIRIWILEHKKRIKIMSYFGASFFMKSGFLYRLVFIDSFISVVLVSTLFIYMQNSTFIMEKLKLLDVEIPSFGIFDGLILLGSSLGLSLIIVSFVSRKMGRE